MLYVFVIELTIVISIILYYTVSIPSEKKKTRSILFGGILLLTAFFSLIWLYGGFPLYQQHEGFPLYYYPCTLAIPIGGILIILSRRRPFLPLFFGMIAFAVLQSFLQISYGFLLCIIGGLLILFGGNIQKKYLQSHISYSTALSHLPLIQIIGGILILIGFFLPWYYWPELITDNTRSGFDIGVVYWRDISENWQYVSEISIWSVPAMAILSIIAALRRKTNLSAIFGAIISYTLLFYFTDIGWFMCMFGCTLPFICDILSKEKSTENNAYTDSDISYANIIRALPLTGGIMISTGFFLPWFRFESGIDFASKHEFLWLVVLFGVLIIIGAVTKKTIITKIFGAATIFLLLFFYNSITGYSLLSIISTLEEMSLGNYIGMIFVFGILFTIGPELFWIKTEEITPYRPSTYEYPSPPPPPTYRVPAVIQLQPLVARNAPCEKTISIPTCDVCGGAIETLSKFCGHCGAKLKVELAEEKRVTVDISKEELITKKEAEEKIITPLKPTPTPIPEEFVNDMKKVQSWKSLGIDVDYLEKLLEDRNFDKFKKEFEILRKQIEG